LRFQTEQIPVSSRLRFRLPSRDDAAFYLKLMNEPDYRHFIADHGLSSEEDAISYIENKTLARFSMFGVGLWLVEKKDTGDPIGVCGLVIRPELENPDIGYGLLEDYRGKGYALEAAEAVLEFAQEELKLECLCAITHPDNTPSGKLLKKLGFTRQGQRQLSEIGAIADYYFRELSAAEKGKS
jgi:RimJ/RimL family protein N-acetyltransferase